MKVTRIAALGVALVVGSAAVASGQSATSEPQQQQGRGPGRRLLPPDITLTADQKAKLDTIQKKYQPELTKAFEEAGADRAEGFKKSAPIREKMSTEIRAILT